MEPAVPPLGVIFEWSTAELAATIDRLSVAPADPPTPRGIDVSDGGGSSHSWFAALGPSVRDRGAAPGALARQSWLTVARRELHERQVVAMEFGVDRPLPRLSTALPSAPHPMTSVLPPLSLPLGDTLPVNPDGTPLSPSSFFAHLARQQQPQPVAVAAATRTGVTEPASLDRGAPERAHRPGPSAAARPASARPHHPPAWAVSDPHRDRTSESSGISILDEITSAQPGTTAAECERFDLVWLGFVY